MGLLQCLPRLTAAENKLRTCGQGFGRRSAELLAYAQINSHRAENVSLARPGAISEKRILRPFFSFARGAISETRILGCFFSFARGWPWPSSPLDEKKLSRTLCLFISF